MSLDLYSSILQRGSDHFLIYATTPRLTSVYDNIFGKYVSMDGASVGLGVNCT